MSMVRVAMRLRSQLVLVLARNRLTRTAAVRGFVRSGECVPGKRGLVLVLARNRLTRTAAERGFVLSGECVPGGWVQNMLA